jgi:hypothetical protein
MQCTGGSADISYLALAEFLESHIISGCRCNAGLGSNGTAALCGTGRATARTDQIAFAVARRGGGRGCIMRHNMVASRCGLDMDKLF